MEANDEVELVEELGPTGLTSSKKLSHREILKVFVVCEYFYGVQRALKVLLPLLESAEDHQ